MRRHEAWRWLRRRLVPLVLVACGVGGTALARPLPSPAGAPPSCHSATLIAVDESGSEFGAPVTGQGGTDPHNLRGRAALAAGEALAADRLCAQAVTFTTFGTGVHLLGTIHGGQRIPAAIRSALLSPTNHRSWTNTLGVLQGSAALLGAGGARSLVIVTDGYPQLPGVPDGTMRRRVATMLLRLGALGVAVYVVLVQARRASPTFTAWDRVWSRGALQTHGGYATIHAAQGIDGAVAQVVGAIETANVSGTVARTPIRRTVAVSGPTGQLQVEVGGTTTPLRVAVACPGLPPIRRRFSHGYGVVTVADPRAGGTCTISVTTRQPGVPVHVGTLLLPAPGPGTAQASPVRPRGRLGWGALAALGAALLVAFAARLLAGGQVALPIRVTHEGQTVFDAEGGVPRRGLRARLRPRRVLVLGDRPDNDGQLPDTPAGAWFALRAGRSHELAMRGAQVEVDGVPLAPTAWTDTSPTAHVVLRDPGRTHLASFGVIFHPPNPTDPTHPSDWTGPAHHSTLEGGEAWP